MKVRKDRYNIWADNRPHDAAWKAEMKYREDNQYHAIPDFAAYPDQLLYEKHGDERMAVSASRDSQLNQRIEAEAYLERVTRWNQKRLEQIKQGNRLAEYLVELYGDLPLYRLAMKWERGDKENLTQAEVPVTDAQGELWEKA